MPTDDAVPDRVILDRLHTAVRQWLHVATAGGKSELDLASVTADVVAAGRPFLQLPQERRDALLRQVPRSGLVLLSQFGRAAFDNLIEAMLVVPQQRERLRNLSSLLVQQFGRRSSFDRSDLYMLGLMKLLQTAATRWPDFADEQKFDAYLTAILRNILRKRARKKEARAGSEELFDAAPGRELAPEDQIELNEAEAEFNEAERVLEERLARLEPPQLRAVCLLKWRHQWSYPELAAVWPDLSEPASERQGVQARAKWIEREYRKFIAGA